MTVFTVIGFQVYYGSGYRAGNNKTSVKEMSESKQKRDEIYKRDILIGIVQLAQ